MVETIKKLCKERNMTLNALEKECSIANRTIYRWDEHTPSVDKVRRVADFFDLTVDELLRKDDAVSKQATSD